MRIFIFFLLVFLFNSSFAQRSAAWTASPFDQKVFVENKGQFPEEVLFQAMCGDVAVNFTRNAVVYRYDELTVKEEIPGKKMKREERVSVKNHVVEMTWLGSSPSAEVSADEKVSYYYTYPNSIRAEAWQKITYRNLYPGIDAEYILPDKGGIKYSLIVHPGADISKIKMKWGGEEVGVDPKGNMIIKSSMGNFVDHAPETFYADDKHSIPSAFSVRDNIVSFVVSPSSINHLPSTIIIDPWTTNPNFPGYNAAYDVEYDLAGNVYAYGGRGTAASPFRVIKFNNLGAAQWTYVGTIFAANNIFYGDFTVDGNSGSSYLIEGYMPGTGAGAGVIKLNAAGVQLAYFAGNDTIEELWRANFNNCSKQGVLVGGGTSKAYQAYVLDTTLTTFKPVNVLGVTTPLHDFSLLTIDNAGRHYMASARSGKHPTVKDNVLLSGPASTLVPLSYTVQDNHAFLEITSIPYVNNSGTNPFSLANGFNGIAVSNKYVYTYDGSLIQRWNKTTGAFINSAVISPTPFTWGGLAVDDCDHIFAGVQSSIIQLDTNFTTVATIPTPNTVYDVRLAPGNLLYACGRQFVSSFNVTGTSLSCGGTSATMSVMVSSSGSCSTGGSATVAVTGGSPGYAYSWNPSGQTASTATGLSAGTYTVIITDSDCIQNVQTATVNITAGTLSSSVTATQASCLSPNGTASVSAIGGTSPYTYQWSNASTGSQISNLAPGNYSVTITDASGCTGTASVSVTSSNGPNVLVASQASVSCNGGNNGSASATASGGTSPYTYNWSNGQTTSAATNLSAGNYSVTVTDANSCTQTQTISIAQPTAITTTVTATSASCGNSDGTASATGSGGTPSYSYSWSNSQTTSSISNLAPGNYSVTITDANGCSQTAIASVPQTGGPTVTAGTTITILQGSSTNLSSSAPGATTYSWTPTAGLSCSNCSNPVASPTQTTEYCAYAYDAAGCYDSACVTVHVTTVIEPSDCSQASAEKILLPTAFSPNWDSQNDVVKILFNEMECIEALSIHIYNRWGEEVFRSDDPYFIWDGKYKGKIENTAVFAYILEATLTNGENVNKKGNISLLR